MEGEEATGIVKILLSRVTTAFASDFQVHLHVQFIYHRPNFLIALEVEDTLTAARWQGGTFSLIAYHTALRIEPVTCT